MKIPRAHGWILIFSILYLFSLSSCALFGKRPDASTQSVFEREVTEAIANTPASCGRLIELLQRIEGTADAVQASAYLEAAECAERSGDEARAVRWYTVVSDQFPHVMFEAYGGSFSAAVEARRKLTLLLGPSAWFSRELEPLAGHVETALSDGDPDALMERASRADFAVGAIESGWAYADPDEAIDQLLRRPHGPLRFGPRFTNPFAGTTNSDVLIQTTGWEGGAPYLYLWFRLDKHLGWEWAGWLESNRALPPDQN